MGLGELFRRLFAPVPEPKRIALTDVASWLERQEEEARELAALREERTRQFRQEIAERVTILEGVTLDERKADPRLKAIVKGNLKKYIEHLTHLDPENLLAFHQKSAKNYERATLLVGEELGETKKVIAAFAQFMKRHQEEEAPRRARIEANLARLEEEAPLRKRVHELRKRFQAEKRREEAQRAAIEKENEKIRAQQAAHERERKALRQNILRLKAMIDFKRLGDIFHASTEMASVKEYRERFETAVENEKGLVALLDEAKMMNEEIAALLATIGAQRRALRPPRPEARYLPSSAAKELAKEEALLAKATHEREERLKSIKEDLEALGMILEV